MKPPLGSKNSKSSKRSKSSKSWWHSAGWLLLPIFWLNVAYYDRLPEAYQSHVFDAHIPFSLAFSENILRVFTLGLPFLVRLEVDSPLQRRGLGLFVVGALVYAASWVVLILAPESAYARSALGFMAPAYTVGLWLLGLYWLSERLLLETLPYDRRWYGIAAFAFWLLHTTHAGLVYARL